VPALGIKAGPPAANCEIAELALHPGARVNRFEEKVVFPAAPAVWLQKN
jgi:hypothetical protein